MRTAEQNTEPFSCVELIPLATAPIEFNTKCGSPGMGACHSVLCEFRLLRNGNNFGGSSD
jgi:hypothetical protein